ncbi:MAG: response regulator transcription factor [Balneolaceae bacterium]|nr:response regulator transcription factor [Balneolaceae bacterium]MBO6546354.1 response regulator transcription factor [Balneolaceae bacterium]MBO6648713.1 response regulator transcription factor [Balneolaceae bacterium]
MNNKKQITVIIADDEKPARDVIRVYLEKDKRFFLISECSNGKEALEMIKARSPGLLLLDIEMPELNGIDLVSQLENNSSHIVFITAYKEYAIEAFEENAIDYILKPFSEDRFNKMLDRVADENKSGNEISLQAIQKVVDILQVREKRSFLKKISVKKKGKISFISVDQIMWMESEGAYLKLHLKDKSWELVNYSMKEIESELDPERYIRIHKSYIVNIEEIESMESYFHGEYIVTMNDGNELKLSRTYKEKLNLILKQYDS